MPDPSDKLDQILGLLGQFSERLDGVCSRMDGLEEKENGKTGKPNGADPGRPEPVLDSADPYEVQRVTHEAKDLHDRLAAKHREVEAAMLKINRHQLSQREHQEIADAQARADGAYQAWARRAPAPIPGETPVMYRNRLAAGMADHSEAWASFFKGNSLADQPEEARAMIEAGVYADACAAALRNPFDLDDGQERMLERRDPVSGTPIRTFYRKGHFIRDFAAPSRQLVNADEIRRIEKMREAARSVGDSGQFIGGY